MGGFKTAEEVAEVIHTPCNRCFSRHQCPDWFRHILAVLGTDLCGLPVRGSGKSTTAKLIWTCPKGSSSVQSFQPREMYLASTGICSFHLSNGSLLQAYEKQDFLDRLRWHDQLDEQMIWKD